MDALDKSLDQVVAESKAAKAQAQKAKKAKKKMNQPKGKVRSAS
jgi:hypothetical protein